MILARCCAVVLSLVIANSLASTPRQSAQQMVDSAVDLAMEQGTAAAISAISKPDGPFVDGELYVFVYDTNGMIVAHSRNPKLIGKTVLDVPDVQGRRFRRTILETAMSDARCGWVEYMYENPLTGRIERKSTWVRQHGRYIFCCGVYFGN